MTQTPPTTEPGPDPMQAAQDAASARVANEFPDDPTSAPAAPAAPPDDTPLDIFDDGAIENLDLGNMQYRDGKKLEQEIRKARDQFRPFRDALDGMDDDSRQAFLDAAPNLGDDLAMLASTASGLHPDDRQFFASAMELMASDPDRAAEMLAAGAQQIRQALGGDEPAPASAPPVAGETPPDAPTGFPGDNDPVTFAQLRAWEEAQGQQREVANATAQILQEARELGYDPEATEGPARTLTNAYFEALARTSDPTKAHAEVEAFKQGLIDSFVAGKSADADRPAPPADAGGAPAPQGAPHESLDDARAAMLARLEGQLGPDPRRRGGD